MGKDTHRRQIGLLVVLIIFALAAGIVGAFVSYGERAACPLKAPPRVDGQLTAPATVSLITGAMLATGQLSGSLPEYKYHRLRPQSAPDCA